jgi:hypothetical protein
MRFKNTAILLLLLLAGLGVYFFVVRSLASGTSSSMDVLGRTQHSFSYSPSKPQNGKLKGVIEIGSTGFSSFVIHVDQQKRWEMVAKDFGVSLVYEGLATTEDIRKGIDQYISKMFDNAVPRDQIHFVVSSGAQKAPKVDTIIRELKSMGYNLATVSPEQEARFGYLATVPAAYRNRAFFVDIGSSNTKVAWEEGGNIRTVELPGSKYFSIPLSDEQVYNQVKQQVAGLPDALRATAFIIGGVPFQLAEQNRGEEERYTLLRPYASYKADNQRLASGLNLYKSISEHTGCKQFVFDWDANFTIGYLLDQP